MFLPQEVIRIKRDGGTLSADEIAEFIAGLTSGTVSEGQAAAFAMAVLFQKMTLQERVPLTEAMANSGTRLDWSGIDRPVVDKHSTGGVGDNVSLMLAPIVAACGGAVPMISGRGLGHTGGTLDKMESIPGYQVKPDVALFRQVVREVGCAIIGQTDDLAPADKRLYGIRDVTATVESIDLITASILSKKIAAGLDCLVLDVKFGNGAFMSNPADAEALAQSLVAVANGAGVTTSAILTDMNQPLAPAAGNAVEVISAVQFLTGENQPARLKRVTLALAAEMLFRAKLFDSVEDANRAAESALDGGRAAELFDQMVAALGGAPGIIQSGGLDRLAAAPISRPVACMEEGVIAAADTRQLGLAVVALGGGRTNPSDAVDPRVGLTEIAEIGQPVQRGQPLAFVHAKDEASADHAADQVRAALHIGQRTDVAPALGPYIAPDGVVT